MRRTRIVLQARTTSTRLPAKVLLPIGGLPLAVLCARRLAATGLDVVLATSSARSDDLLAATAADHGIRVFRGSLENVLDRFLGCTADLDDDDLVVRTTADNPVPDGQFIEELIHAFGQAHTDYLGTSSPADGLPYGLSAEVFTAAALRRAATENQDPYASEHVTPHLRQVSGVTGIVPRGAFFDDDRSALRVTVDTLDDYLSIAECFRRVVSPESISWRQLLDILGVDGRAPKPVPGKSVRGQYYGCVTLGTAQLGLAYGVTNKIGRPSDGEARAILGLAMEAGVTHVDTARAYGDAESRIGSLIPRRVAERLRIVSKLCPLSDLPQDAGARDVYNAVDASVYGSCRDLQRSSVDVMMFHRSTEILRWNGAAIDRLATHVKQGSIREIGVSVYTPEEAVRGLEEQRLTHLQIPFNLLDHRWLCADFQRALAERPDVKVHARSVFLQGLLLADASRWPPWAESAAAVVSTVQALVQSLRRESAADLCIAYARAFPWITSLVLGVDTAAQLQELLELAHRVPLTPADAAAVGRAFRSVPERLVNPALW